MYPATKFETVTLPQRAVILEFSRHQPTEQTLDKLYQEAEQAGTLDEGTYTVFYSFESMSILRRRYEGEAETLTAYEWREIHTRIHSITSKSIVAPLAKLYQ